MIKDNVNEKKVKASSKYKGIVKTTCKGDKFIAQITQKGKRQYLGTFASSYDAALYRDIYILNNNIDKSKMNFKIDYVETKSINDFKRIVKPIKKKSKKITFSSEYMGVTKRKTKTGLVRYDVSISVNYKSSYIGRFNTEIEAAQAYNDYIINNNLNRKLNEIS